MTTIQRELPMVQPKTRVSRPLASRVATSVLGGVLYVALWLFGRILDAAAPRGGDSLRRSGKRED